MSNTTPQFKLFTDPKPSPHEQYFKYCACGPTNMPENIRTPCDVFLLFWGEILDDVVAAINQEIQTNVNWTGKARKEKFVVTRDIFLAWIGCWIELGLHPSDDIKEAFSAEEGNALLRTYFYRDEFRAIYTALWHIKEDVFEKIEAHLNKTFPKYWIPFRELSVDEGMALFKGHWHNKVYLPAKPIRFGLKYYLFVDAALYLLQFKLYRKETKETMRSMINNFASALPSDNGQYAIYADNYYGGLDLAADMHTKGLAFVLNCRANRPTELFANYLHKHMTTTEVGRVAFAETADGIVACSWKDNSVVNFLTNVHFNESVEVERIYNGNITHIMIPHVAQDYSQVGMGHVDAFDAQISRYRAEHRNTSWKRAHFLQLLQYSIFNSFLIYRMHTKQPDLTHKKYLKIARHSFVQNYGVNLAIKEKARVDKKREKARNRQKRCRKAKKQKINTKEQAKKLAGAQALLELNKTIIIKHPARPIRK